MRRKYLIPLALLAVAVALMAGCVLPSYQLQFEITSVDTPPAGTGYVRVNYTLTNVGYEKLYDAFVEITVYDDTGYPHVAETPNFDLDVYDWIDGTIDVYLDGATNAGPVVNEVFVSKAGWNTEDNSF